MKSVANPCNLHETCGNCKGKGELKATRKRLLICPICHATGYKEIKCSKCEKGKFTLKNGRVVDCLACKGTSVFRRVECHRCDCNTSYLMKSKVPKGYLLEIYQATFVCPDCKGKGQVTLDLWNPAMTQNSGLKALGW